MNLFELASKYAELKGTKIIPGAYSEREDKIVFVVEAGQKRTMTAEQLEQEIAQMQKTIREEVGSDAPPVRSSLPDNGGETPEPPKKKAEGPATGGRKKKS